MEIKYEYMDLESVLTFWDILVEMLLLDTAVWRILQQFSIWI